MKRLRLPLVHPLAEVFFAAVRSVTTSMSDSTREKVYSETEITARLEQELPRWIYEGGWIRHPWLHVVSSQQRLDQRSLHPAPMRFDIFIAPLVRQVFYQYPISWAVKFE